MRCTQVADWPIPDGVCFLPRLGDRGRYPNEAMLIRPLVLIGLVAMLATTGCNRTDRRLAFNAHSKSAIPKTATLIHSGAQYAGFDASYGFVFDVTDGAIVDQLVKEWKLEPGRTSGGFFKFAKHTWWPNDDDLGKIEHGYSRENKESEEYWNVWYDKPNGRVLVEHGGW
jgi:hypothetical protein